MERDGWVISIWKDNSYYDLSHICTPDEASSMWGDTEITGDCCIGCSAPMPEDMRRRVNLLNKIKEKL